LLSEGGAVRSVKVDRYQSVEITKKAKKKVENDLRVLNDTVPYEYAAMLACVLGSGVSPHQGPQTEGSEMIGMPDAEDV
jgi:hypothetical protein